MISLILQTFWLLLPAGVANMSPVLFKKINFLNYPVDLGMKFRKKPLFGKNKTYRGFFFGTLMSILTVYIESLFHLDNIIGYNNIILLGLLLGFGALLGDVIESFFKRQLDIKPGKSLIPFDQIDWVLGSIILTGFVYFIPLNVIITSIILFGILHPLINLLGFLMKIKKNKF